MAQDSQPEAPTGRRPTEGVLARHFGRRVDPLTSAVVVFPLLLTYQLGILGGNGQNAVDFATRALVELAARDLDNYLAIVGAMLVGYGAILVLLRRTGTFDPRAFVPVLLESGFYALSMGSIILYLMQRMLPDLPMSLGSGSAALHVLVVSAGAGLHEELFFRVLGMGGIGWLLAGFTGPRRAWVLALLISSVLFSLAHHVGPMGQPFSFAVFTYRVLAGVFFALVYQLRGFAVAAWTHALYDVYALGAAS